MRFRKLLSRLVLATAMTALFASAVAQTLPKLNVHSISNRTFGISWPYTNAGFALQESSGLTNWQSSTLAPTFDSNSAAFSVSASATNTARFFRLRQPADPRGIYVYVGLDTFTNSPAYNGRISACV